MSIIPIPAPALPSIYDNVTLTSSGNGDSVIVKWSDNNSTADNFTVYWSINSAGPININNSSSYTGSVTVSSASSSTTINSLNLGDNVSIVVAGNNYSGTGTPTTESSVVTALNYTLNSPVISFVSGLNGIQIRIDNSTGGNNPWSSTHPGADGWVIYISQTDNVTINDNRSIILPPTEYSTGNHPNVITVKSSSNPADWDTTDAFSRNCESDCVWYYQHYSKGYQYIRAQVINSVTGAASTLSNELRTVQIPTGTIADNYALYVHPTATTQRYTQSMETFSASPEQWKQTSTGFVKNALVDVGEPVTLTWNLAASDDYVDNYTLYRVDQNAQILTDNQSIPFSVLSNATVIQTITDNSTSTSISIPTKNTGYAYVICAENEAGALCSENTYARVYAFNQSNPYDEINENKSFQYRTHPNGLGVNDWRGYAEINSLTRDVTHLNKFQNG